MIAASESEVHHRSSKLLDIRRDAKQLYSPTHPTTMTTMRSIQRLTPLTKSLQPTTSTILATQQKVRTYYSIYHPDPSPFPPIQSAILSSSLSHVPRLGFTQDALLAGAKENNYLEVSTQLFPRGAYELIHYHLVTERLALKDRVQFPENSKLGLGQKVKTLTWARLQANKDVIQHWQDALGQMSLLENIPASLKELGNLSDEIWYLSGDTTVDFSWYTKRAQLSAVYAATETFMTTDQSTEFRDTEEFLDRRLEDARFLGGVAGGVGRYAGWWAGNGLGLARAWGMKV